jgi:hypothetical protein
MELKKKFKKIGFIFGLKREMKLVSYKNNNIVCVYGYGKASTQTILLFLYETSFISLFNPKIKPIFLNFFLSSIIWVNGILF